MTLDKVYQPSGCSLFHLGRADVCMYVCIYVCMYVCYRFLGTRFPPPFNIGFLTFRLLLVTIAEDLEESC